MEDIDERRAVLARAVREGGDVALEAFRRTVDVETKRGPLDAVTDVDRRVEREVAATVRESFPGEPVVGEEGESDRGAADAVDCGARDADAVPERGPAWVVDPIDGTSNYVRGIRVWTTSAALTVDGDPVEAVNYLPALGDTYATTRSGVTRNGDPVSVSDRSDPGALLVGTTFGTREPHREGLRLTTRRVTDRFGDLRRFGSGQAALSMVASGELDAVVATVCLHPWDSLAGVALVQAAGGTVTDVRGDPWRHDSVGLVASNGRAHDMLVDALRSTEEQ
ncbi:MAG: inositol monophosphatase [Haloferacaceae archaeon]